MDGYGVLDGYEDGYSGDDEKGSRAIPSRTILGREAAFIKEFPEYGGVKSFLFGLIKIRNWGYRCYLTLPQIELMMADLPHPLFPQKAGESGNKAYSQSDIDEATALTMAAMKRNREKHPIQDREQSYTLEEVFNGDAD